MSDILYSLPNMLTPRNVGPAALSPTVQYDCAALTNPTAQGWCYCKKLGLGYTAALERCAVTRPSPYPEE